MHQSQERHYNILKLNKWFAISSLLFTFVWLLVFANDFNRQWKPYQKTFRKLEIEKIRLDRSAAEKELASNEKYDLVSSELQDAENELSSNEDKLNSFQITIDTLKAEQYRMNQLYQFSKALYDAQKYTVEQAMFGHGEKQVEAAKLNRLKEETLTFKMDLESIESYLETEEESVKKIQSNVKKAKDRVGRVKRSKVLLERRLKKTDPEAMSFANKIGNVVRDLPILDFINPYYEVKQVVVKDLKDDLIFLDVPKVDRCVTCHLGIDKPGFEDAQQPYTTHPDLEKYIAPNSAHPMKEFGCTTCHMGRGRGTDFISSVHYPDSEEQKKEWEEKYHWHKLHHWSEPMLPMSLVEASCYKCHSGTMPVKGAPKLSLGLAIVEKGGCFGCHQIDRWEETPKSGPGLKKIASKTTKDFAYKWIYAPREFRHDTWMPHFFKQINSNNEESIKRTNQEIHAIVTFLFNQSESYKMDRVSTGNIENGRMLVNSLGCKGCHRMEEDSESEWETSFNSMRRQQGPNLIHLGSKTSQRWVYNWIRNPQGYHPESKMPNLRLNKQEAADISAFLVSNRNEEFDSQIIPDLNEGELNKIVKSFLEQTRRKKEVDSVLDTMDINHKLNFAGEKLVSHYGCFGCHDISGFENAKPIGTPLSIEGSKLITKLDFGYLHDEIDHTKWDWFRLKLDNPRIYDMIPQGEQNYEMKVKRPLEKMRMPHFGLNEDELDAIVTVIMGWVDDELPADKLPPRTTRNMVVEEGERLLQTYNCKGCHNIDGDGGAILSTVAEWLEEVGGTESAEDANLVQSFGPPILNSEGKKVQPTWLYNFFKNPIMIRPNLQVRMPSFNMISNNDWNKMIKYFQYKDDQMLAYENPHKVNRNSTKYKAGKVIQELGACNNCHFYGSKKPKQAALTWAPNLALTKERLRPGWVVDWLRDPQAIMPGTKMPAPYLPVDEPTEDVRSNWGKDVAKLHPDSEILLNALRDYLWGLEGRKDVSSIVKKHLKVEGYGFIVEDEEDEDW